MPDDDNGAGTGAANDNAASAGGGATSTANGFPAETPIDQMNAEQQAAYWKTQARKHESRVKAMGSPDDIKELRAAKTELDKLRKQTATDQERAVIEARESAQRETADKFARQLVTAEFRAATSGRVSADDLADFLAPMDLSFFLSDDHTVDVAKVTQLASKLVGAGQQSGASGNGATNGAATGAFPFIGQGRRETGQSDPFAAGAAAFEARKGRNNSF